jgi:CheY-like chemotaxis protein
MLAPTGGMSSILVVDDSLPIALILERHLREAGHHVTLAHDGTDALKQMARGTPDCIFLDLMMPVMTGIELLHQLRRDPAMAKIPVVIVSARVGEGRAKVCSEGEADYSVGKPFTRRKVLSAVETVMRERVRRPVPLLGQTHQDRRIDPPALTRRSPYWSPDEQPAA